MTARGPRLPHNLEPRRAGNPDHVARRQEKARRAAALEAYRRWREAEYLGLPKAQAGR